MALADNLGKKVRLMIVKEVEFGVYLGNKEEKIRWMYSYIRILRTG